MTDLADLIRLCTTLTNDSRQVTNGALFVAYAGSQHDGRDYIAQAIAQGAKAVIAEAQGCKWREEWQVPHILLNRLTEQLGIIAAEFYQYPSKRMRVLGVTGTNGKTSVTYWLAYCLSQLGIKTALSGTLGKGFLPDLAPSDNTTPDAIALQGWLAAMLKQQAHIAVMEVSSHALAQGRVNDMSFDMALFTQLGRDHLDYHLDQAAYRAAKAKLFRVTGLRAVVINADDAFGQELLTQDYTCAVWSYGVHHGAVRAEILSRSTRGLALMLHTPRGSVKTQLPFSADFMLYNALAVVGGLMAMGVALVDIAQLIATLPMVSGRMQGLGGDGKPYVVVDYAHTPDALETVLQSLRRDLPKAAKLLCVFGCGGDRDVGKRAEMGEVARQLADSVWLTTDNSRHESPDKIIADIVGKNHETYTVILDRRQAIRQAVLSARANDVILVAGKGHETTQEINGVSYQFSDVQVVEESLQAWGQAI